MTKISNVKQIKY